MQKIGVLALQGAVREHAQALHRLGAEAIVVKKYEQLQNVDALIIPGGESTTIANLMHIYNLAGPICKFAQTKPIMGTCAGFILLARKIQGFSDSHLGLLDVEVVRNGFGRQSESFEATLDISNVADKFKAVFIRAPYVSQIGEGVKVLSYFQDKIVAVEQNNLLGFSFHPELTGDDSVHRYFLNKIEGSKC